MRKELMGALAATVALSGLGGACSKPDANPKPHLEQVSVGIPSEQNKANLTANKDRIMLIGGQISGFINPRADLAYWNGLLGDFRNLDAWDQHFLLQIDSLTKGTFQYWQFTRFKGSPSLTVDYNQKPNTLADVTIGLQLGGGDGVMSIDPMGHPYQLGPNVGANQLYDLANNAFSIPDALDEAAHTNWNNRSPGFFEFNETFVGDHGPQRLDIKIFKKDAPPELNPRDRTIEASISQVA